MVNVVIFASGSGSNAEKIMERFKEHDTVKVQAVFANSAKAGVLDRATRFGIPTYVFNRTAFYETDEVLNQLEKFETDLVVLAGFLWLVPENLLGEKFDIVNIHPGLLPKFGGPGMYGMNVHRAVKAANEKKSGMTIHFVNNEYDKGEIIFQASCDLEPEDSPEKIAERVLELEHKYYPQVIEDLALKRIKNK